METVNIKLINPTNNSDIDIGCPENILMKDIFNQLIDANFLSQGHSYSGVLKCEDTLPNSLPLDNNKTIMENGVNNNAIIQILIDDVKTEINSLSDFNKLLHQLGEGAFYYRGESKEYPTIASSLLRKKKNIHKYESLVNDFFSEVINKIDDQIKKNFIPFCQHHGLYTNLIDLTESPYVALYFSCIGHNSNKGFMHLFYKSNTIDMTDIIKTRLCAPAPCYNVMQYRERDRYVNDSIWNDFLNTYVEKLRKMDNHDCYIKLRSWLENWLHSQIYNNPDYNYFRVDRDNITLSIEKYFDMMVMSGLKYLFPEIPYVIFKPDNVFDRVKNQNSLFIYQLFISHPSPINSNDVDTYIQGIVPDRTILINNQQSILDELDYMGINEKYIFSDYENIAKHTNRRYF